MLHLLLSSDQMTELADCTLCQGVETCLLCMLGVVHNTCVQLETCCMQHFPLLAAQKKLYTACALSLSTTHLQVPALPGS